MNRRGSHTCHPFMQELMLQTATVRNVLAATGRPLLLEKLEGLQLR